MPPSRLIELCGEVDASAYVCRPLLLLLENRLYCVFWNFDPNRNPMIKDVTQLLIALALFAVALPVDAANVSVTTSAMPKIAGTTSGGGPFASGSSVTVTADATNDCYEFVAWTAGGVKKSTNSSYTFTATRFEALVAVFARIKYTISVSSFPTNAGILTGAGKKPCGTLATLTAHAKTGFAFEGWSLDGITVISSNIYKFTVGDNANFVANFKDIGPPSVKILSPQKNEPITTAGFPIQGTASDNVSVAAVYYNLNGTGWVEATPEGTFANWYAWVTLTPNSINTILAYAIDTSGNTNPAVLTTFPCTSAGYAPLSISGHEAALSNATETCSSSIVSFDLASYVRVTPCTNDVGEVGTYTYTPTGPNTAEFVPHRFVPREDPSNQTVLELTFSDAFNATFTNLTGDGGGTFSFVTTVDTAPVTLDAATVVATSFITSNLTSTTTFGTSTFNSQDSLGASNSGTYTFTKFTAVSGLLVEMVTNPPAVGVTTNYILLSFVEETSPQTGYYDYQSGTADTNGGFDTGTFVLHPGTDTTKFLGPPTLSGLRATITPQGEPAFMRFYGNGTYASLSLLSSQEPTDVGINLANPRVSANTGTDQFFASAPPYILGLDDETVELTFTSPTAATELINGALQTTAKVTYAKLTPTVPAALTGHTIMATPAGGGKSSAMSFNYNQFSTGNGGAGSGTFTYSPYAPTVALLQANFNAGTDAGESTYLILEFTTAIGGTYVQAQQNPANSGQWTFVKGHFLMTTTKS